MGISRRRFEPQQAPPGINLTGVWMRPDPHASSRRYAIVHDAHNRLMLATTWNDAVPVAVFDGSYAPETTVTIAGLPGHLLDGQHFVIDGWDGPASRPAHFLRSPDVSDAVCFLLGKFLMISPHPEVRHHIASTLGFMPHPALVDRLIPVLAHPDAAVRFNAIEALWNQQDERLVEPMVTLVRAFLAGDRPPAAAWGTSQILYHLARVPDTQVTPILIQVFQSADLSDDLRITAARSLMQQNPQHGVPVVLDSFPHLAEPLQERIERLLPDLNDPVFLDFLPPYLTSTDPALQVHVAGILSLLGHPAALDSLVQSLQTTVYPHTATYLARLSDPRIIPALIHRVPTAPPPLRATIFHALGRFRDDRAIPSLEAGLDDPEPTVKLAAASGLARIQAQVQRAGLTLDETHASASTESPDAAALQEFATIRDELAQLATSPAWGIAAAATETLRRYAKAPPDPDPDR